MHRSSRPPFVALLVVILVAACTSTSSPSAPPSPTPPASDLPSSPAPSTNAAAVYAAIAAQVEQIRGLRPTAAITPVLLDEAQLEANLAQDFDRENPPALVAVAQDELSELGLLPAGSSLRQAEIDLRAGQVAGYYSALRKQLFVVSRSGGIGPTQRVTYAHEFTHQLQDQNFDLATLGLDSPDQGDRSLARLSLVEGDAVTAQTTWMSQNLTAGDLAQVLADASDPTAVAALTNAPPFLRTIALFPYTAGETFVGVLIATGGEAAVNGAFGQPPASTEQILHPAAYLAHEAPLAVSLPGGLATSLGQGWRQAGLDTLGELQIRTWLSVDGVAQATATTAAAGWGGDRLAVLDGPAGARALALVTRWDAATDPDEFASAVASAVAAMPGTVLVGTTAATRTVRVVVAPTSALAESLLAALGS